jgi:hypothetical protein
MKPIALTTLVLLASTSVLAAQNKDAGAPVASPVVSTVRQMETRFAKNLTGAADTMPADKYSYRPTPEQITFGHLMMHTAEANNTLCAAVAGEQPKEVKLSETDTKDVLSKAVGDSFAYCEQVLSKADESTLGQAATLPGGRTTTRGGALVTMVAGWADHYSMAAMYLRLNNLTPPSAQKPASK